MNRQYTFIEVLVGRKVVGRVLKVGKFWLATTGNGVGGGFKSARKAYAAVLRASDPHGKHQMKARGK